MNRDMMGCRAWGCGFVGRGLPGLRETLPSPAPVFCYSRERGGMAPPSASLVPQAGAAVCTLRLRPFPLAPDAAAAPLFAIALSDVLSDGHSGIVEPHLSAPAVAADWAQRLRRAGSPPLQGFPIRLT